MTTTDEKSAQFMLAAHGLPTLWDLGETELQLLALLDDGDLTDDLARRLEEVETAVAQKAEACVSVVRTLQALSSARKAEADRLRERSATAERAADRLLKRLLDYMKTTGKTRLETNRFTVSVRQNPARVEVTEPMLIPHEFERTKITVEPDKVAIKKHFEATGEVVPGTSIVRTERLEVR